MQVGGENKKGSGLNTVHLEELGLISGVKSMTGAGGRGRSNDLYGEFLRLTMRGLIFPRLRSHNSFAAASNSLRYHFS